MPKSLHAQLADLRKAIAAQEALRATIGDEVVEAALAVLRQKLAELELSQAAEQTREQRQLAAVLAARVAGLAGAEGTLTAGEVNELMGDFWATIAGLIQTHGGQVEQDRCDGVIAVWGIQAMREDDTEQAVRAALRIRQELSQLTARRPFQMKIAIHNGPPQVAEFLAEQARPGEVVLSQDSLRLVRGLFDVEPCAVVPLDDNERTLSLYRVLRPRPYAFRAHTRGVEGVETRMVGREAELATLQEALLAAAQGQKARALTIIGEAGIGKSRLLYELETWLERRPRQFWTIKGRATERALTQPYALIHAALALLLQIPDDTPLETARQKMEQAISALLPGDPAAQEKAQFIGHLLGLDFSASPALSGILTDPGQIRDRAHFALAQVISAVAARRPVLLLLEDLHWADEASLDLITYLMNEVQGLPVLLIVLARPGLLDRYPGWAERFPDHQQIELLPLNESASRLLVGEILQRVAFVPAILNELVIAGAEGNPFYIEEFIKVLIDERIITTGEIWEVDQARLENLPLPATMTGILQARLASLPADERTILQAAAALGRTFWDGALVSLTGLEAGAITAALGRLETRELVFPRETPSFSGQREYVFKHALLLQAAYEQIPRRQSRQYHLSAAEWLLAQSGKRAPEFAALIAGHLEAAEDFYRACAWYAQAGKHAYEAYVPELAVNFYKKALSLAAQARFHSPEILAWYENQGKSLFALANYAAALNAYQEMRAAADRFANVNGLAQAWYHIAYVHDHLGNNSLSLESAENALRLAGMGANQETLLKALNGKGWALYRLGDGNSALALGEKTLRLARDLGDPILAQREQAQAYQLLGAAHELRGNLRESEACEAQALDIFRRLRNRRGEAAMLNNQGVGAFIRGDYAAALARYTEALQVAQQIGSKDRLIMFLSNLGGAKVGLGDFVAAETDLRRVLATVGAQMTHFLPRTYLFLAEALLGQGKLDEACEAARNGLKLAQEAEMADVICAAYRTLGNCSARYQQLGRPLEPRLAPETCFRASLDIAEEQGFSPDRARTLRDWAGYAAACGDQARAEALRQTARELFEKLEMPLEVARLDHK